MGKSMDHSRGFDAGNYAAAYESETFDEEAIEGKSAAFAAGYMLGFFSSYEAHEVPEEHQERVAALRAEHGE